MLAGVPDVAPHGVQEQENPDSAEQVHRDPALAGSVAGEGRHQGIQAGKEQHRLVVGAVVPGDVRRTDEENDGREVAQHRAIVE